ncbi:MAG: tetraacyldisaccharide 4'-kinase [Acidobacteriota bacterium]
MIPDLTPPRRTRSPWQRFYEGGHALRRRYWSSRARRLPRPVVSIGNLHWGGAGKTPLTAAVAAHLRDAGWRVVILSRGYGSKGEGVRVVSTGQGPLLGPSSAGDEPVLLAGLLPGVSVVVAPERWEAGRHALERLEPAPQIFLLDDGFSHLRLHRDLDLLAFPAADPFAGGRLPPGGRLREPMVAARRADAALLTGLPPQALSAGAGESAALGERLAAALRGFGFRGSGFACSLEAESPRFDRDRPLPDGAPVLLVSAIARPERFRATVENQGWQVADELTYGDHHAYPESTLKAIQQRFEESSAAVVLTTAKDRVKLHGRLDLPLAELPIAARPEDSFFRWLDARLAPLRDQSEQGAE